MAPEGQKHFLVVSVVNKRRQRIADGLAQGAPRTVTGSGSKSDRRRIEVVAPPAYAANLPQ